VLGFKIGIGVSGDCEDCAMSWESFSLFNYMVNFCVHKGSTRSWGKISSSARQFVGLFP
jgi:hypothetical protein